MQNLIIWEGCDGCGKTNIAAAVSEKLGIPVYKSGLEDQMFYDKDSQYLVLKHGNYEMIKLLDVANSNIMFDRFFPSEWVYSQVFNRQQGLDIVLALDEYWSRLGGKIIWLDKPNIEESDELVPKSKYNEIRQKYKEYMNLTKCDVLYLDTTDRNLEKQVNLISKFIME